MAVGLLYSEALLGFPDPGNAISGRDDPSITIIDGLESRLRERGVDVVRITAEELSGDGFALPPEVRLIYLFPLNGPFDGLNQKVRERIEAFDDRGLLLNPLRALLSQVDKARTAEIFRKHGVPHPETLISSDGAELAAFVKKHGIAIFKPVYGAGGDHIIFLEWHDDGVVARVPINGRVERLPCVFKDYPSGTPIPFHVYGEGGRRVLHMHGPVVAQEVIREDGSWNSKVLKVYVIDGRPAFGVELSREASTPEESIITYANARHRLISAAALPPGAADVAVRAAASIGLRACLVDMIRKHGGWVALETNGDNTYTIHDRGYRFAEGFERGKEFDFDGHLANTLAAEEALSDGKRIPRAGDPKNAPHAARRGEVLSDGKRIPRAGDPLAREKGAFPLRSGQFPPAPPAKPNKSTVR